MNVELEKTILYLNAVNGKVLKSVIINGGKNLDGTYKPSGFLSVRLVKQAEEEFKKAILSLNLKSVRDYPNFIEIDKAKGFLTYEEWDKGKKFTAVINEVVFTTNSDKEVVEKLPF